MLIGDVINSNKANILKLSRLITQSSLFKTNLLIYVVLLNSLLNERL